MSPGERPRRPDGHRTGAIVGHGRVRHTRNTVGNFLSPDVRLLVCGLHPGEYNGSDRFPDKEATGVISVAEQPVSTFSVDVDTASYAVVRRLLSSGKLPLREAVRVEEMVNYFPYTYPAPSDRAQPFRVTTTVTPSPWNSGNQLLHIALRGYDITRTERPRANLVLLIDTSGSMAPDDRLPLLQQAFRLFVEQLRPDDRLAIVTYAGATRVALEPTPGHAKDRMLAALNRDQILPHSGNHVSPLCENL